MEQGKENYVIGMDFGTDSVRSIIVDAADGREIAASVFYYPRWKAGRYCDPAENRYRQHPLDYIEGIEATIKDCVRQAGPEKARAVRAISVDTTGSTPVAVDRSGTPLGLLPGFEEDPNALFVLWKDRSGIVEPVEGPADRVRYFEVARVNQDGGPRGYDGDVCRTGDYPSDPGRGSGPMPPCGGGSNIPCPGGEGYETQDNGGDGA